MAKSRRRSYFLVPSFIVFMLHRRGSHGQQGVSAASSGPDDADQSLRAFTKGLRHRRAELRRSGVKPEKGVYKGAIPGMLTRTARSALQFLRSARLRGALREDQRGRYYGVGMQVTCAQQQDHCPRRPSLDPPAYKAGIRPGDVILEVNDKKTDGLTTTRKIADLLKATALQHQGSGQDRPRGPRSAAWCSISSASRQNPAV